MAVAKTVGGKFNSIGGAGEQAENLALVTKLMGEIGADGMALVEPKDKAFIDDCRYKLQSKGPSHTRMFGWRQVEALVKVHAGVVAKRKAAQIGVS